jgi:hypothetical protein
MAGENRKAASGGDAVVKQARRDPVIISKCAQS